MVKRINVSASEKLLKNFNNVLLNNKYRKPMRKFIITVVPPTPVSENAKTSTKTVCKNFIITVNDAPKILNYKLIK